MNTKVLMTTSALFMAIIGMLLSFFPHETAAYFDIEENTLTILLLKVLSALYLGFGILNWMAKGTIIGGIYNRPIAIGNMMHFLVGAIAFAKIASGIQTHSEILIAFTAVYVIFAILFAYVFRTHPAKSK